MSQPEQWRDPRGSSARSDSPASPRASGQEELEASLASAAHDYEGLTLFFTPFEAQSLRLAARTKGQTLRAYLISCSQAEIATREIA